MPAADTLQVYFERFALVSLEKQDKLESLIGEHMHELDLDAGKIRFPQFEFPMQVIGTESGNTLNWLWAWADEQTEIPVNLLQSAIQLRTWGENERVPEFTIPSVDLNRADGHVLSLISSEVCRASCYYQDSYEGGAVFLLLFNRIIDSQSPFNRERLLFRLSDIFSRYDMNHRHTLLSYFRMKGMTAVEEGNLINCDLASGERVNAEFDDAGRLTMINGTPFEW